MKRIYRAAALVAALMFTFLLASEAHAQMGGGMGGMGGGRRGMGGGGAGSGNGDCKPSQAPPDMNSSMQIDIHLTQLQGALRLKPEQGAAWQAFVSRVHALAEDVAREQGRTMDLRPGADTGPLPGLKHVSRALDAARSRLSALDDVDAATRALYLTLTPEQKAVADMHVPEVVAPRPFAPVGGPPNG